jgi:SAM-dependent methyltransferase
VHVSKARTPSTSSSGRYPRSAAYSRYAAVYDEIGQRAFGERIAEATLDYLALSGANPKTAVDLACGTGAATLVLAATGMRVIGLDNSEAMLAVARRSAVEARLPVQWQLDDMRDFRIDTPVDLVTCFYDGVNYLTEPAEIEALFQSVTRALVPGGLFVFDLNTREKFSAAWNDACYVAVDRDDLFGIYQSWFQPESGLSPLILTFFVRSESGQWDRFDEEHIERAYPLDEIGTMLCNAGFTIRAMLDYVDRLPRFGGPGSERSQRVVFVAERPTGDSKEAVP